MKKNLFITIFILFLALPVWAGNIYVEIKQEQSVSEIQEEIQFAIACIMDYESVYVTGSKTNADEMLSLIIPTERTVVWSAFYKSSYPFSAQALIHFEGNGTFEIGYDGALITENAHVVRAYATKSTVVVSGNGKLQTSGDFVLGTTEEVRAISTSGNVEIKDNAQLIGTGGEVIGTFDDNTNILISGGSITTLSGNAIVTYGKDPNILISGGYLSNDANNTYPTIIAFDPRPDSKAMIHVSGTAKVEAKGKGNAISSYGTVKLSGNAQVSNNLAGDNIIAAIRSRDVEIFDNAKVSARKNSAIACLDNGTVKVSENGTVEAKENAVAIRFLSNSIPYGRLEIKDNAQVTAENNYAVLHNLQYFTLYLTGGVVFAYGKDISDVIKNTNNVYVSDTGTILAWNKAAGNTHYEKYSNDDILIYPTSATAFWDYQEGKQGITFANGYNAGFIPLEVNVLSISETQGSSALHVYPNPTSNVLRVTSDKLRVASVEIFDVLGRKQKSRRAEEQKGENSLNPDFQKAPLVAEDGVVIDISDLPSGVYFLKVSNTVKKIVKQ